MKRILLGLLILLVLGYAGWARAATQVDWQRNSESDMASYKVYACLSKGCVPTTPQAVPPGPPAVATVPQPAVGIRPLWILPAMTEGSVAVTAVDTSGNESGLSVAVPFDTKPPAIPSDVRTN